MALTHCLTKYFHSELRYHWRKIRRHHDHSFASQAKDQGKNPAYWRHQISRLMRIVEPLKILRGCMIYQNNKKNAVKKIWG